ncbi:DUF4232 domain-containing protein [Amycolatopsis pigmentata]|uniref:DUF4232 domain-containing protein n=1 Tax=Amycolatopsis pigmentata TaxID=450801 RepID=A0ABW5G3F1_9PSEU
MAVASAAVMVGCSSTDHNTAAPAPPPTAASANVVALNGADSAAANDNKESEYAAKRVGVPGCRHLTTAIYNDAPATTNEPAPPQFRIAFAFRNPGPKCVVRGFPGVRFDGEDGTSWNVDRTNEPTMDVVLEPGERAIANFTYMVADEATGWHVKSVSITPPNTYDTQTFPWEQGALNKQDGAAHPGTYVSPVRVEQ